MKSNRSLVGDTASLQSIRDLFASEKPPSINSVDIAQIVYLITHKAEEKEIFDSQQTVARALGCDVKTVVRSQKRLQKLGWIARPQRKGRTCALSLQFQNIPFEQTVRTIITQDAKTLSLRYMTALKGKGLRRKFPNAWLGRQYLSAQKILDRCTGSLELAEQIVTFAVMNPRLQNKARKSLYELHGQWPKVRATFDAAHPETANQPTQQPVPAAQPSRQTQPTPPPQSLPAYTIRRTAHPGVGLRWNAQTNRLEELMSGALITNGEIPTRISKAGLRRDLLSGQFQDFSTREPLTPDEIQERLMGTEVWQEERTMEVAQ